MRATTVQAIDFLKRLDLTKYPYEEIRKQISNIGVVAHMGIVFHPGKSVYRARPNSIDEHFYSKCQLTHKPQQFNKTYQRASTPNMTMFYGSVLPEEFETGELDESRVVPSYEAVPWLRDKSTKGHRKITYSKWFATQDINLIAILQHDKYYDNSSYTRRLMKNFRRFLNEHPDKKDETIAFTTFLACEFAKEVKIDHDYLISAAFTQSIVEKGYDGVLYPSVKLDGTGFNVALTPNAADSKLQLGLVVECSAYKYYDKTVLDNDYQAILYPSQTNFELLEIENDDHAGIQECLDQLGIKSIDDLIK